MSEKLNEFKGCSSVYTSPEGTFKQLIVTDHDQDLEYVLMDHDDITIIINPEEQISGTLAAAPQKDNEHALALIDKKMFMWPEQVQQLFAKPHIVHVKRVVPTPSTICF